MTTAPSNKGINLKEETMMGRKFRGFCEFRQFGLFLRNLIPTKKMSHKDLQKFIIVKVLKILIHKRLSLHPRKLFKKIYLKINKAKSEMNQKHLEYQGDKNG